MRSLLTWADYFGTAWCSLRQHRLRSLLTILGVVVGVASVVLLIAIVQGVKTEVTRQIQQFGANLLFVIPGRVDMGQPFNPMSVLGLSTLNRQDVQVLIEVPGVQRAVPVMFIAGGARNEGLWTTSAIVIATESTWQQIHFVPVAEGRFFSAQEHNQRVCVLAHGAKHDLFRDAPALGKAVVINRVAFRVIGVLQPAEQDGLFGNVGWNNLILLPLQAAQSAMKSEQIHRIVVQAVPGVEPESLINRVRQAVRQSHMGIEDFSVLTQRDLLKLIYNVLSLLQMALISIGSISLIVGGVGLMNIMLVSVTQRTREIGIRRAVGATRRDIFWQFLMEAVILSVTGGVLGVILAASSVEVIRSATTLSPLITLGSIALAFGVSVMVGVVFGIAPAIGAARKEPIEALRYE